MRRAVEQAALAQLLASPSDASPGMGLSSRECGLAPIGGRPPAGVGERYVGVRCGGRSTQRVDKGLFEEYTLILTITFRCGRVAFDRLGQTLMNESADGFNDFSDFVRLTIHGDLIDNRIISRANTIIGTNGGPFVTAFEFLGDDDPYPVGASWFHAAGSEDSEVGIVQNLRFGMAQRVQSYVSTQGVN